MTIINNGEPPREVFNLTDKQRNDILVYLQGMVYGWCASKHQEPFAARDLVGGVNGDWRGTPIQCVYEKQTTDEDTAFTVAAQEIGRLLKRVIIDDQREFTCEKDGLGTSQYTWNNIPK